MLHLMARSNFEHRQNKRNAVANFLRFALLSIAINIRIACAILVFTEVSNAQNLEPSQTPPRVEDVDKTKETEEKPPTEPEQSKSADSSENTEAKSAKPEVVGDEEIKVPPIMRDLSKLPFPVKRMRELILEAALSGDIEKLRPLVGFGEDVTMLSLGGIEEDPLGFLKSLAGDDDGHEILAILAEVLESGYVHLDKGTEHELYVWPYFFAYPLDKLSARQKVELYRLVTHGDYQDMESFGAYIFYRLGISPRGRWRFFVAGD